MTSPDAEQGIPNSGDGVGTAGGFSLMSSLTGGGGGGGASVVTARSDGDDSTARLREGLASGGGVNSNKSTGSSSTISGSNNNNAGGSPWPSSRSSHHHPLRSPPIVPSSSYPSSTLLAKANLIQKTRSFNSTSGYQQPLQQATTITTRRSANYRHAPNKVISSKNQQPLPPPPQSLRGSGGGAGGGFLGASPRDVANQQSGVGVVVSPNGRFQFPGLSLSSSMDSAEVKSPPSIRSGDGVSGGGGGDINNHIRTSSFGNSVTNGYCDAFALLGHGEEGSDGRNLRRGCVTVSPTRKNILQKMMPSSPRRAAASGFLAIGDYSPSSPSNSKAGGVVVGESPLTVFTSPDGIAIPQFLKHDEGIARFSIRHDEGVVEESPLSVATASAGKSILRSASPLRHASPSRLKQSIANTWIKAKGVSVRSRSPAPVGKLSVIGGGIRGKSPNPSQVASQALWENESTIDSGGRPPMSGEESTSSKSELRRSEDEIYSQTPVGGGSTRNRSPSPVRNTSGESEGSASGSQSGVAKWRIPSSSGRVRCSLKKALALPISSSFRGAQPQQQLPPHPPQSPKELLRVWGELDDDNDGTPNRSIGLVQTTMCFDVDADLAIWAIDSPGANGVLQSTPISPTVSPRREEQQWEQRQSSIIDLELEEQEGNAKREYFINTTSFNVFESLEFLRAMGGNVSEASVATNYIRTGDSFFDGELTDDLDRAVNVYYAALGAVLTRIKEWSLQRDYDGAENDDDGDESRTLMDYDFLQAAHCPATNILLLVISSILLRVGNAHFRLKQYEVACRDYVSAQSYRMMRNEATEIIEKERTEIHIEDAKLNGRISNNLASAQSKRGLYDEARSEYTKALQIKQSTLEALHNAGSSDNGAKKDIDNNLVSDIASTFHNIGLLRMNCGEPQKAEKAYKQSLSLRVKKFGLNDLGVSSSLLALGDLYYHKKQYDDAFRSYKESLRIHKLHCTKSDLKTADHYYNIGLVFYSKGPYIKAKSAVAECLRIRRQQLAPNEHLPVASALHLLGLIATSLGNYVEALSLLQESLSIRQQLLRQRDHLLLLNVQLALGIVHQKKYDFDNAMSCFSVALAGRSRRLGKVHGSVSDVLQAIGVTYTEANEYHKALKTLDGALQIRRTPLGSSIGVAETLNALSVVYFKSGDAAMAVELTEEALDVLKVAVRFDHCLVSKVLKNVGDYYQNGQAYDDALEAYNESLCVFTAYYGNDHVFLSEVLNEIGVTRFKNGDFITAQQSFTEALRLMRLTQNEENKSAIFHTLNHLGHALFKSNELELAAETYIESFNIQVSIVTGVANDGLKEFGTKLNSIKNRVATMEQDDDNVSGLSDSLGGIASILRYLGLVIQEQGDFEAALSANKLSLSVRLCQPVKDHTAIALVAETIAMFEYKRNNLDSAMDYFNQALEAKKISQGECTIDVARTVNNLANIHFSLGNLDDAMELYEEALEIKTHCLGDDSDEVANTLNNIAHVMVNAGKEQEALEVYHKVVKIRQDLYGKSHASVAAALASMGDIYIKLAQLDVAMTYFEQCIRIQKLNEDHCDERILQNLGSIYGKLGEWQKAESIFKKIVEFKRSAHGNNCLDVAKTLDLLAVSFIEQDRYLESVEHLEEALRIRKACLDHADDEILASLNKLAFVYKSLEMTEQMLAMKSEFEATQASRRVGSS